MSLHAEGTFHCRTAWNPSWVDFYVWLLRGSMRLDQEINGTWKNLGQLVDRLITHVVPQVLGPLEADGRSVKPSLVHGGTYMLQATHGDTS
jgi:protein-ribulosamine 3-kinase